MKIRLLLFKIYSQQFNNHEAGNFTIGKFLKLVEEEYSFDQMSCTATCGKDLQETRLFL